MGGTASTPTSEYHPQSTFVVLAGYDVDDSLALVENTTMCLNLGSQHSFGELAACYPQIFGVMGAATIEFKLRDASRMPVGKTQVDPPLILANYTTEGFFPSTTKLGWVRQQFANKEFYLELHMTMPSSSSGGG